MTSIREFRCQDLFRLSNINLDKFTENFHLPFYMQYLARWPEYFEIAEGPSGRPMGYSK